MSPRAAFWGPFSSEVGYLLIVSGGGLAGYGVAAHRLVALEAAAAVWLGALLILINDRFGLELHATVVLVAAVLLAVLDVERYRRTRNGLAQSEVLRAAEWLVMVLPLMIAVGKSFDSLAYLLLLAAEGAALMTWGGITRVRRRAIVGLIAITTAIVLAVLIPLVGEVREGLTGGGWLIVGAVAALIFIVAGSLIEKQRVRIGEQLSRWSEILEAWE